MSVGFRYVCYCPMRMLYIRIEASYAFKEALMLHMHTKVIDTINNAAMLWDGAVRPTNSRGVIPTLCPVFMMPLLIPAARGLLVVRITTPPSFPPSPPFRLLTLVPQWQWYKPSVLLHTLDDRSRLELRLVPLMIAARRIPNRQ